MRGALNSGLLGDRGEEAAEAGNAFLILPLNPRMIDEGVPMGDKVAQTHSTTHVFRKIPIDRSPIRQDDKSRGRVIRSVPPLVHHPMQGKIDTFLNGEEEVKARQILGIRFGEKFLGRT